MFAAYLQRWGLVPDGEPILTPTSRLLPVRYGGLPAMLKIAVAHEEKAGARLMQWWDGRGAAPVLAFDDDAILLKRAHCVPSLVQLVRDGSDDEASLIICKTVAGLHAPRADAPPRLVALDIWFSALWPQAKAHGGVLQVAATAASKLLAEQQDVCVLHGDIHHGNILYFGSRGWLAVDPKGLKGERAFDYANLFCNPDLNVATQPGRLARHLAIVSRAAGLDRRFAFIRTASIGAEFDSKSSNRDRAVLRASSVLEAIGSTPLQ
jgi:streptomycin 6-kinase